MNGPDRRFGWTMLVGLLAMAIAGASLVVSAIATFSSAVVAPREASTVGLFFMPSVLSLGLCSAMLLRIARRRAADTIRLSPAAQLILVVLCNLGMLILLVFILRPMMASTHRPIIDMPGFSSLGPTLAAFATALACTAQVLYRRWWFAASGSQTS